LNIEYDTFVYGRHLTSGSGVVGIMRDTVIHRDNTCCHLSSFCITLSNTSHSKRLIYNTCLL